ncbi:putative transcription regulator SOH1 family [Helianthus anomalus]
MASGQEIDDSSNNNSSPKKVYKDPDDGRQRFLLEVEFNRYFEDEAFIGYLKYLQYWQRPEYIKYII